MMQMFQGIAGRANGRWIAAGMFGTVLMVGAPAAHAQQEQGLAAEYPGDEGIAEDPAAIYATDFENGIEPPLRERRNNVSIIEDSHLARTGNGLARIAAIRGEDTGGDLRIQWAEGVEQAYVRVYVRFDEDTAMPHHFVNLGGNTPTYEYRFGGGAGERPPGDEDGAFRTTLEPPKGPDDRWQFYTYWHEMRSWQTEEGESDGRDNAYYGNNFRAVRPTPPLPRDKWVCLEYMVKLNTLGEHDGEMAFWIDGVKYGHWKPGTPAEGRWLRENFYTYGPFFENYDNPVPFEGFSWREHPSLQINKATLQWYLSDRVYDEDSVDENIVYFDNFVIATEYIGPIEE